MDSGKDVSSARWCLTLTSCPHLLFVEMEAVLKDCWLSHCWLRWQLWIQSVALWLPPGPDGPVLDLGCFSAGHHLAVAGWLWPHGQQSGGACLREPARCTRPLGPAGCRQGCTWEKQCQVLCRSLVLANLRSLGHRDVRVTGRPATTKDKKGMFQTGRNWHLKRQIDIIK